MYTTHGFPPELFETMATEHNLGFDWEGFHREMERHGNDLRRRARRWSCSRRARSTHSRKPWTRQNSWATRRPRPRVRLSASSPTASSATKSTRSATRQPISVVLDQTPFYGESGGQVGDAGELVGPGCRFEVIQTQKEDGFTLHGGHLRQGGLAIGDKVTARVDTARRQGIRRAHSATHILHYALQKHLGKHAQQQGSKVDRDWLRFDFANPSALDREKVAVDRSGSECPDQRAARRSAGARCPSPRPARRAP